MKSVRYAPLPSVSQGPSKTPYCPVPTSTTTTSRPLTCYSCGQTGHILTDPQCPNYKTCARSPSLRASTIEEYATSPAPDGTGHSEPASNASMAEGSGYNSQPELTSTGDAQPEEVDDWEDATQDYSGPEEGQVGNVGTDGDSEDDDDVLAVGYISMREDSDLGIFHRAVYIESSSSNNEDFRMHMAGIRKRKKAKGKAKADLPVSHTTTKR